MGRKVIEVEVEVVVLVLVVEVEVSFGWVVASPAGRLINELVPDDSLARWSWPSWRFAGARFGTFRGLLRFCWCELLEFCGWITRSGLMLTNTAGCSLLDEGLDEFE